METLEQVRSKFVDLCIGTKLEKEGVYAVTYQPLKSRVNQDRVVTEKWDIGGQSWLFLAVCGGHGGIETAEFTARSLPGHIYAALQALNLLPDGFDPKGNHEYHARISALLNEEIEKFDREIGEAVTALCKDPRKVTEANARLLIETHSEVLSRAYHGTTLTVALINNTQEDLWVANIGDSTVALSCANSDGTRSGQRLLELHTPTTPSEYFRVSMSHPAVESDIFLYDRLFGALSMTQAIGNFSLKFHSSYLTQLFSYLPTTASARYIPGITKHSKTPPYLIAKPDLKYINLQQFRNRNPILLLFTDGIDLLASGGFDAKATRRKDDPSAVVGALLSEQDEQRLEGILGHGAKSKWYEGDGNRAIEILGNLLGGTDAGKLAMTMDPEIIFAADNAEFYVDDTSLIVYDIFKSTVPGT